MFYRSGMNLHASFLFSDVEDTYHTVAFKLISAFKWISKSSKVMKNDGLEWILKLDDDILLDFDQLQKYIQNESNSSSIHCHMYHYVEPYRKNNSRW